MTVTRTAVALIWIGGFCTLTMASAAIAQPVPRSFQASPDVYKVVAENDQYRIVEVKWKPGQRDTWHSHGPMTGIYNLTDCATRVYLPDGKTTELNRKAGDARLGAQAPSHSVENIGKSECKVVMFELK